MAQFIVNAQLRFIHRTACYPVTDHKDAIKHLFYNSSLSTQ